MDIPAAGRGYREVDGHGFAIRYYPVGSGRADGALPL